MASNNSLEDFLEQASHDIEQEAATNEAAQQSQEIERQNFLKLFQDLAHRDILPFFERVKKLETEHFAVEIPDVARHLGDPATLRIIIRESKIKSRSEQLKLAPRYKGKCVEVSNSVPPDYSFVANLSLNQITEEYLDNQIRKVVAKLKDQR